MGPNETEKVKVISYYDILGSQSYRNSPLPKISSHHYRYLTYPNKTPFSTPATKTVMPPALTQPLSHQHHELRGSSSSHLLQLISTTSLRLTPTIISHPNPTMPQSYLQKLMVHINFLYQWCVMLVVLDCSPFKGRQSQHGGGQEVTAKV